MVEQFLLSNYLSLNLNAMFQCKCSNFAYLTIWVQMNSNRLNIFITLKYLTKSFSNQYIKALCRKKLL
jgi:hypothetical protein